METLFYCYRLSMLDYSKNMLEQGTSLYQQFQILMIYPETMMLVFPLMAQKQRRAKLLVL